jgi:hypothetical protein
VVTWYASLNSYAQANSVESMRSFNNEAMNLAVRGVTIVVSTGDDGAANGADYCDFDSSSDKWSPYWKVRHALSAVLALCTVCVDIRVAADGGVFHRGRFTCSTYQYIVSHG